MKNAILYCMTALVVATAVVSSCKEAVDEGDFAIAEGNTISQYLSGNDSLKLITQLLSRVTLSHRDNASSLIGVLSARGNYTCFFPSDRVMHQYVREVTGTDDVTNLTDEQAELVVYNSVIDNGNMGAFESPDFPIEGTFSVPCLSERLLSCQYDKKSDSYIVNKNARVVASDIECTNGRIHIVDQVVAPSLLTLPDIVKEASNMKIMGQLLQATGWAAKMTEYQDIAFNTREHPEKRTFTGVGTFNMQQDRYLGFTAFVEPDEVFARDWGVPAPKLNGGGNIENFEDILRVVQEKCEAVYGTAQRDDLTHPDNAVNQFVAYHLMKGRYSYNQLTRHFNEYGYKYGSSVLTPQKNVYTVDVWDYFETLGSHRSLLKVVQIPTDDHQIYLNRVSRYSQSNYTTMEVKRPGIEVKPENPGNDNNALNGFYHPIDGILLFDTDTRNALGSERIRYDLVTMLPELTTNNRRGQGYRGFENGYFENITNETSDTQIYYLLAPSGSNWRDYQGDEFLFCGIYDFVVKLPPVPKSGLYEIRMGVAMNPSRSMTQIYFGDDVNRLNPEGLPYDMRQSANNNPSIPWVADCGNDLVDRENDKNLRNQGYMKGPNYFTATNGAGDQPARTFGGDWPCMRRIIGTEYMEPEKTYYLRFKTVLEKRDSQLFLDFFEMVPSEVYNGTEPEDIW